MNNAKVAIEIMKLVKPYHNNLADKNIMFLSDNNGVMEKIEALYNQSNFLHLTGLTLNKNLVRNALEFYDLAIKGMLNETHFFQNKNCQPATSIDEKNIEDKLKALRITVDIHKNAREVADYNNSRPFLKVEKLAGFKVACMGYERYPQNPDLYFPKSNLYGNITGFSNAQNKIAIILVKPKDDLTYSDISYSDKKLVNNIQSYQISDDIKNKLSDSVLTTLNIPLPLPVPVVVNNFTLEDFTISRPTTDVKSFAVTYAESTKTYSLNKGDVKDETIKSIADDFGVTPQLAEDIFDTADNISPLNLLMKKRTENETELSEEISPDISTAELPSTDEREPEMC
jgi:hypothetical protein